MFRHTKQNILGWRPSTMKFLGPTSRSDLTGGILRSGRDGGSVLDAGEGTVFFRGNTEVGSFGDAKKQTV